MRTALMLGGGAVGVALLVALLRRVDVVEVRGQSMVPTLLPGDRLIVARARPRRGHVVITPDPREPRRELIKRVARVDDEGVHLRGEDPLASTDGRSFGAVPPESVTWRAVWRSWPPARFGPVRVQNG